MKRKVCIVVTARPSYSRIRSVLQAVQEHPALELQLVVGASALLDNYGNLDPVITADGFDIARRVHMVVEGENLVTMAKTAGLGLLELATVFDDLKPDIVVTVADRYETLATAIAASYMNIPLAHVQGGEVTGSIDEKVRHAVTKLADLHFVATKKAEERVIRLGEEPGKVFVTGCPSIDVASEVLSHPHLDFSPFEKYGGVGSILDLSRGYLVVLQHPVTTEYQAARRDVGETLRAVHTQPLPVLWFWPNVDAGSDGMSKGIRAFRESEKPDNIHFFKNMAPKDFLTVLYNSKCLIGNSSVAIRECSFLGIPAVNIGNRQLGRERGTNVLDVAYNRDEIRLAIDQHVNNGHFQKDTMYGEGKAGEQIAQLLSMEQLSIEKQLTY